MSLPSLNPSQVGWVASEVAAYISAQRSTYRPGAAQLTAVQRTAMDPFFAESVLGSARVSVLSGAHVPNPPFYPQLIGMGIPPALLPDFGGMAAITFVDTVVFQVPITERTLFHELVHVVQYEKLGLATFAAKYVNGFLTGGGYEHIPLEVNAYQLDSIFAYAPGVGFSVDDIVQTWVNGDMF